MGLIKCLIMWLAPLSAADERSYDWKWEYDYRQSGFVKGPKTFSPLKATFNCLELATTADERAFGFRQWRDAKIARRFYDYRSHVTLDYSAGEGGSWSLSLHDLPGLGYQREISLARFGGRLHLYALDHEDYEFHDYPVRR